MTGASDTRRAEVEPADPAVWQLRAALEDGESFTRIEACDRFGMSGATFRWAIRMRDAGMPLEYEEVRGARNALTRRWKLNPSRST